MKIQKILFIFLTSLALLGCIEQVSPDRPEYIGKWKNKTMYLFISSDGTVLYNRVNGRTKNSINNGEFLGFNGDNFDVGFGAFFGFVKTTFIVTKPPYQDKGKWRMVVDGLKLTKSPDEQNTLTPHSSKTTKVAPAQNCPKGSVRFSFENISVKSAFAIFADYAGLKAKFDQSITASQPMKFECRNWLEVAEELAKNHNLTLRIENGTMYVSKQ